MTFQSKKDSNISRNECAHEMIGVRTRVVKSKRQDLSKLLRSKFERDLIYPTRYRLPSCLSKKSRKDQSLSLSSHAQNLREGVDPYRVRFFAGHTRFATSSKATLDGTHPHRWCAPTYKLVYDMDEPLDIDREPSYSFDLSSRVLRRGGNRGQVIASPRPTRVENYITHNGDFESYTLNGKIYGIETLQKWLEIATETNMSTSVDSAAIAGMVDIIRCKGCFSLSIRYVIGVPQPIPRYNINPVQFILTKEDIVAKTTAAASMNESNHSTNPKACPCQCLFLCKLFTFWSHFAFPWLSLKLHGICFIVAFV